MSKLKVGDEVTMTKYGGTHPRYIGHLGIVVEIRTNVPDDQSIKVQYEDEGIPGYITYGPEKRFRKLTKLERALK